MTTHQMPRQITASIHQDAINRVGHFFNASISTIANELLQNSRRAGASRVDIAVSRGNHITIADDGAGIADPESILAFGLSQWNPATADSENPAGMGLYSLARRQDVRIRSKTADTDAWEVNLTPDHFMARTSALVETVQDYDRPFGTTIEFAGSFSDEAMLTNAARFYPLPVYVNDKPAPQEDFLDNAVHIETWEGVRIGVYAFDHPTGYGQAGTMNFHGTLVHRANLPSISAIQSYWAPKVDVMDCPRLDLTLPTRQEIVQGPFADELREACLAAIYRAMLLQHAPVDIPKTTRDQAHSMGILLPAATAKLQRWQPDDAERPYPEATKPRLDIGHNPILVTAVMSPPDQHALHRAAARNHIEHRLFQSNHHLQGYEWYDALTRMTEYSIHVSDDDGRHDLRDARLDEVQFASRPEQIEFTIRTDSQGVSNRVALTTDLVFQADEDAYMDEVSPLVTLDSDITPTELVNIMTHAFFAPSDDKHADSYHTQKDNHESAYSMTAISLLESQDQAIIDSITAAIQRHIVHQIPAGSQAVIHVRPTDPVRVTISQDE